MDLKGVNSMFKHLKRGVEGVHLVFINSDNCSIYLVELIDIIKVLSIVLILSIISVSGFKIKKEINESILFVSKLLSRNQIVGIEITEYHIEANTINFERRQIR